jgi:hypothetical protein
MKMRIIGAICFLARLCDSRDLSFAVGATIPGRPDELTVSNHGRLSL